MPDTKNTSAGAIAMAIAAGVVIAVMVAAAALASAMAYLAYQGARMLHARREAYRLLPTGDVISEALHNVAAPLTDDSRRVRNLDDEAVDAELVEEDRRPVRTVICAGCSNPLPLGQPEPDWHKTCPRSR